jgi:hypothetical protein
MTPARRAQFAPFVLDLLDFIGEKIVEAMETETSRVAAIGEAAGGVPVLRDRLRENEVVQANFILLLDVIFEERYAAEWWDGFAKMERTEFEKIARDLVGPQGRLAMLRMIAADAGAP